ncbi:protease modulator HflK [Erythrobacter sp. 3-20A1M]|uniref:protease modulator HflK n=1 Tax=Erythrobacter sp. 3-20A1M TaxID=2653850 RepID=UPI0020421FB8|nr:protease modulator HflK [Erythrobacter sp. 3-20A1M]
MDMLDGLRNRVALAMAGKNPWGPPRGKPDSGSNDGNADPGESGGPEGAPSNDGGKGPRNPWLPPSDDKPRRSASIEDIFKNRGPEGPRRTGPGGGGPNFRLPQRSGGKSWLPLLAAVLVGLWLIFTVPHQIGPKEQGIVTWAGGKYSNTLSSGLNFTWPWPIQQVDVEDVSTFRSEPVGGNGENLILTGDQNLVDLSYVIRWNISDLKQFKFQLADPIETVKEVAEFAMRASVAEKELDAVLSGAGRGDIEQRVRNRMQATLDAYKSGISVQGVEIEKADPPKQVIEAFKDVSAAQQNAETDVNRARAYAQQVLARAQGDAAAFDKIYEEYRLAPEVTRRRMYYETMESVLGRTDKTIVEAPGVTPYLPLPEVKRRNQLAAPQEGQ